MIARGDLTRVSLIEPRTRRFHFRKLCNERPSERTARLIDRIKQLLTVGHTRRPKRSCEFDIFVFAAS
ncbi:hypothetical protein R1flu_025448 [Riccia fluitans]|uniref:Uncharacterized protein n=1 Tax=Riccia fluitans TaxID=41844 RepID=A0ABD1Y0R1_9MARC